MKLKKIKLIVMLCLMGLIIGSWSMTAHAYFDRGPVEVSLGHSSVSLKEGESVSVSVKLSPSSSRQLPGCGMPECPQICGEKECLDSKGECTCAGTTYHTYHASAEVSSSNTSVATASYSSGSLHIKATGSGTATITVTGMLRQFNSQKASLTVTVHKKEVETTKPKPTVKETTKAETTKARETTKTETTKAKETTKARETTKAETTKAETTKAKETTKSSKVETDATAKESTAKASTKAEETKPTDGVSVSSVAANESSTVNVTQESESESKTEESKTKESTEQAKAQTTTQEQQETVRSVESDKGTIYFEEITDSLMGKDLFDVIMGKKAYANFEKTDGSGTIYYSWEFCGQDLNESKDLDFNINVLTKNDELSDVVKDKTAVSFEFANEGKFPGKADIYIRVADSFTNGDNIYLYRYDKDKKQAQLISENLTVTNGYANEMLEEGGLYFFTNDKIADGNTFNAFLLIPVVVVIGAVVLIVLKKRNGDKS